jgi:hypothetical protein
MKLHKSPIQFASLPQIAESNCQAAPCGVVSACLPAFIGKQSKTSRATERLHAGIRRDRFGRIRGDGGRPMRNRSYNTVSKKVAIGFDDETMRWRWELGEIIEKYWERHRAEGMSDTEIAEGILVILSDFLREFGLPSKQREIKHALWRAVLIFRASGLAVRWPLPKVGGSRCFSA